MADDLSAVIDTSLSDIQDEITLDNQVEDTQIDDTQVDDQDQSVTDADDQADDQSQSDDKSEDEKGEKKDFGKGDDDVDLRKAAKEVREALNKFRDSDPANKPLAKALRQALGHDLAYQESFKTPEEARVTKASIDALGGQEGLATLQQTATTFEEERSAFKIGDPKVLESIAKDSPEGFKKLVPAALDMLAKSDYDSFSKMMHPHLVDSLVKSNVPAVFDTLMEAAASGDAEMVKKIAGNLVSWFKGQQSTAAQYRQQAVSPEQDKIKAEWDKINAAKDADFSAAWQKQVGDFAISNLEKASKPYTGGLNEGQKTDFINGVIADIQRRLNSDKVYEKQEAAILKTRNVQKIAAFKNAKIQSLIPEAIQAVAGLRRLTPARPGVKTPGVAKPGAKVAAPVTGQGSAAAPIRLAAKPSLGDIDEKTPLEARIGSKALMKSGPYKGKWVTWKGAK